MPGPSSHTRPRAITRSCNSVIAGASCRCAASAAASSPRAVDHHAQKPSMLTIGSAPRSIAHLRGARAHACGDRRGALAELLDEHVGAELEVAREVVEWEAAVVQD